LRWRLVGSTSRSSRSSSATFRPEQLGSRWRPFT
jgi:hypothetical protein